MIGRPYNTRAIFVLCSGLALLSAAGFSARAQSVAEAQPYVPLPDPGYGLYYHEGASSPNFSTRWGYHEGWQDGRRDRNHGELHEPKEKSGYLSPSDHGGQPGITREEFTKEYRLAYSRGYAHGSRL